METRLWLIGLQRQAEKVQHDISGLVAIENKYLSDQKQNHRDFVYFAGIATNGDRCNQQKGQGPYTRDASYRKLIIGNLQTCEIDFLNHKKNLKKSKVNHQLLSQQSNL